MKNFLSIFLLAVCCAVGSLSAQTVAITPTSLEVITPSAATRTFYDIDDVYLTYKAGTVKIFETSSNAQLFTGDTSEVTVTGASHWGAKAAKLSTWYQHATTTTGFRYFVPRRGLSVAYRTSGTTFRLVHNTTKKVLIETHIDSLKITGVTGASNLLTYLRGKYFLEGSRDAWSLPSAVTAATGAAAGASPTIAVTASTGNSAVITLTTGSSTTTTGVLFTLTLPVTYPTGVIPTITAGDADSGALIARTFATSTAGTVVLNASGTALTAATEYVYYVRWEGY